MTVYNKNSSSKCNLTAQMEPVQDKIVLSFLLIGKNNCIHSTWENNCTHSTWENNCTNSTWENNCTHST